MPDRPPLDPPPSDPLALDPLALHEEFFARDTRDVAHDLIGATLTVGDVAGEIVETEAYRGDPASHFVTRRHTGRIMGETYGRLYVYCIYGMHHCVNITTERDHPGAVLLRAVRPVRGIETMRERRSGRRDRDLASGPARLVVALGIDPAWSGRPFHEVLTLTPPDVRPAVVTGPRIGITKATELPWRFMAAESPYVSKGGTRRHRRVRAK